MSSDETQTVKNVPQQIEVGAKDVFTRKLKPLPSITPFQEPVKFHTGLPTVPSLSRTLGTRKLKSLPPVSAGSRQLLAPLKPLTGCKRKPSNPGLMALISASREFVSGSDAFKSKLAVLAASGTDDTAISRAALEARNDLWCKLAEITHLGSQLGPALKSETEFFARDVNAKCSSIATSHSDLGQACTALSCLKQHVFEARSSLLLFHAAINGSNGSNGMNASLILAATAQQARTFGPGALNLALAAESELSLGLQRLLAGDFAAVKKLGISAETIPEECLSHETIRNIQTIAELGPLLQFCPEPIRVPQKTPLKAYTVDVGSVPELPTLSRAVTVEPSMSVADLASPIQKYASRLEKQFWQAIHQPNEMLHCLEIALDVGLFLDGKYLCDLLDAASEDPNQNAHELLLLNYLHDRGMPKFAVYRDKFPELSFALCPPSKLTDYCLAPLTKALTKTHTTIVRLCLSAKHSAFERNISQLDLAGQQLEMLRSQISASVKQMQKGVDHHSHPFDFRASLQQASSSILQALNSAIAG